MKQINKLNLSEIYFLLTFRFRAVFYTLIIKPDMMINIDLLCCRKWWCFLLSSILSFIVGVFSVLFIRACAAIFCRKVNHKVCTSALLLKTKVAHNVQHDLDYPGQSEIREEKEKEKRQRLAGHHADTGQEQTVGGDVRY